MKKIMLKALFALLPTLFFGTLQAQTQPKSTLVEIPQSGIVEYSLIRTYNEMMLYYVRTTTDNFFVLNSVEGTEAPHAFIDFRYEVSDMEIIDEYLYFCGHDNVQNRGFIGVFRILDFFEGNRAIIIHDEFYGQNNTIVEDIHRICAFFNNNTNLPQIIALGNTNNKDCVIEIPHADGDNSFSWNYDIGWTNKFNERFIDVSATENYAVTAGYLNNDNTNITLRAYDKDNIFSLPFCDTIYPYYSYGSGDWLDYGYDDFHLTALEQNHVATYSTMRIVDTFQTPLSMRNGLLLNLYNITSMIGSTAHSPTYSNSITHIDNTGLAVVNALCYDNLHNRLLGMAHYQGLHPMSPTGNSWITEMVINPLAPVYTTRYSEKYWFQNGTIDATNSRYFTIGYNITDPQNLVVMTNEYDMDGCEEKIPMTHPDNYSLSAKEERSPFATNQGETVAEEIAPIEIIPLPIEYQCIQ